MTEDSWSRVVKKPIHGQDLISCIGIEDLIISKVGRHYEQKSVNPYEADKNARDIVATINAASKPDFDYMVKRLAEGARRGRPPNSAIHPLDWYFVREVETYRKIASTDHKKIESFVSRILSESRSASVEYHLLHSLGRTGDVGRFRSDFMLNDRALSKLLDRWSFLSVQGGTATTTARKIQDYLKLLPKEEVSDYARNLAFSGKDKQAG